MNEQNKNCVTLSLIKAWHEQKRKDCKAFLQLCTNMRKNLPPRPYHCNILNLINPVEPKVSAIIASILSYRTSKGDYPLAKSFAKRFFNIDSLNSPQITYEKDRFDVAIRTKKVWIIIENKIKGAQFQLNQMARYIAKAKEQKPCPDVKLALIPNCIGISYLHNIVNSVYRLPPDWRLPNTSRKCRIDDYTCMCDASGCDKEFRTSHCNQCTDFTEEYKTKTIVINNDFIDWLQKDCQPLVPENESLLRSSIIQLSDYLAILYGLTNKEYKMELLEFLRKELLSENISDEDKVKKLEETIKDAQDTLDAMQRLKAKTIIESWRKRLELNPIYGEKLRHDEFSFGIAINGIWCGCWGGNDNKQEKSGVYQPYWGFFSERKVPTDEQVKMVKKILEQCEINLQVTQKEGWMVWDNTNCGDEDCAKFYDAAKSLGYL